MTGPRISVGALIELQVDDRGFLNERTTYQATRRIDATGAPAVVVIRGDLDAAAASAGAARQIGAALATAERIDVLGSGPGLVEFAAMIRDAAAEERAFRAAS